MENIVSLKNNFFIVNISECSSKFRFRNEIKFFYKDFILSNL